MAVGTEDANDSGLGLELYVLESCSTSFLVGLLSVDSDESWGSVEGNSDDGEFGSEEL